MDDLKTAKPYSALQLLLLLRLIRLLRQRELCRTVANGDGWERVIDKMIYATYVDCCGAGIGEDARVAVERDRKTN